MKYKEDLISQSTGRLSTLCGRDARILKKTWPTQDGHSLEEEHRLEEEEGKLKDGVEKSERKK